jgi:hypothetical protein
MPLATEPCQSTYIVPRAKWDSRAKMESFSTRTAIPGATPGCSCGDPMFKVTFARTLPTQKSNDQRQTVSAMAPTIWSSAISPVFLTSYEDTSLCSSYLVRTNVRFLCWLENESFCPSSWWQSEADHEEGWTWEDWGYAD